MEMQQEDEDCEKMSRHAGKIGHLSFYARGEFLNIV